MGGAQRSSRMSATESQLIQQGFDNRISEKIDAVAETIRAAVMKMDALMNKYWQDEMSVKVMGMDGQTYWVSYSANDMQGEYDIEIDPESMVQQPPGSKKQELAALIQALSNRPGVNINYLLRLMLREHRWIDVMEALPQSPLAPMNADEFIAQQLQLAQGAPQGNPGQGGAQPTPGPQQGAA